ncbi:MAG TPA: hypothetical protein DD640_03515 [Clostridiales bacterium]|nr:hypothetical protein [Clostridiales bacterium]
MRFLRLLSLKILDLLAMRSLLIVLLLAPLALGLLAGSANLANQEPDIRLAVVDRDQTDASRTLIARLAQNGWAVTETDGAAAEKSLLRGQVDGIVTIEAGYAGNLTTLAEAKITYVQAEGSLVTALVREAVAAAVLPEYSRKSLLAELRRQYEAAGLQPPEDLETSFAAGVSSYIDGPAKLQIDYIGRISTTPALTFVVSDYSMEVFFLSIYAILGTLTLSQAGLRRRLAASRRGLALDYALSVTALFLLGMTQIFVFTGAMRLLMASPFRIREILLLAVYLVLILGLGQLFTFINPSLRLYLSLLILLLLSVAGGCFFQLSAALLGKIGQYTPQGWVLSQIKGYDSLPFTMPLALSALFLVLGYLLQKRQVSRDD